MLGRIAPLILALSACGPIDAPPAAPLTGQCPAPERPAPLQLEVEPIEGSLAPGRAAAFHVTPSAPGGLRALIARLGERLAHTARLDDERWLVLAPIDVDEEAEALPLLLEGATWDDRFVVGLERVALEEASYPTRHIRVSRRFLRRLGNRRSPAPSAEERRLERALATYTEQRMWRGSFVRPTRTAQTSAFGVRRVGRGHELGRHLGQDLDGRVGYRVRAAGGGRVVMLGRHHYAGLTVLIDHGGGLFTHYLHLSRWAVAEGDVVRKGQVIARMGKSGRVTGPHLHFAALLRGSYVDPAALVALDLSDDEAPLRSERVVSRSGASASGRVVSSTTREPAGTQARCLAATSS